MGTINSDGDLVIVNAVSIFYNYQFKPNTQYTISATWKSSNTTGNVRLQFIYTDDSFSDLIIGGNSLEYKYSKITSKANKTIKNIRLYYGSSGSLIIKNAEIMLNEGTIALPYEPYKPSVDERLESVEEAKTLLLYPGAGAHNAIYRGKYLGTAVTDEQYAAIAAGTFDDLYIGDYWKINGVNW